MITDPKKLQPCAGKADVSYFHDPDLWKIAQKLYKEKLLIFGAPVYFFPKPTAPR